MATRIYLPSSGSAPCSPAYSGDWDNTSAYPASRLPCYASKQSTAMVTVSLDGNADSSDADYLVRQWVSEQLAAQTISAQTIKVQIRLMEENSRANQYLALCIRVVSSDGATVRGTLVTLTRDGTELATSLTNRGWSAYL